MSEPLTVTAPPSVKDRLAAMLPLLCLVHCAGTAVLASVMPAAAMWLHNEWLEGVLSLFSALLIGTLVLRRPSPLDAIAVLFGAAVAVGALGWICNLAWFRHGSLLMLVGVQALWFRDHRRRHHASHSDSAHGHVHDACACTGHAQH